MKNILITIGPIPARLDSVKFLTNRFKGGLALQTAEKLKEFGHDVTIIAWKYLLLNTSIPIIYIDDVVDYYNKVLEFKADTYILAAAVANLMPSSPYEGKFPSHLYKVGDKFNLEFEISPRVIDKIKEKYPKCTLIAYKLFDGTTEELIEAGRKTLYESKANLVFANFPNSAKYKKIALTSDGASINLNFEEHIELINHLISQEWYKTNIVKIDNPILNSSDEVVITNYPKHQVDKYIFGSFAIRKDKGFVTTRRGKLKENIDSIAYVRSVNHKDYIVSSNTKASLNTPLFSKLFELNPQINFIIHGHSLIGDILHNKYEFPGTIGDLNNAHSFLGEKIIQLKHHGFLACFNNFESCNNFMSSYENKLANI